MHHSLRHIVHEEICQQAYWVESKLLLLHLYNIGPLLCALSLHWQLDQQEGDSVSNL